MRSLFCSFFSTSSRVRWICSAGETIFLDQLIPERNGNIDFVFTWHEKPMFGVELNLVAKKIDKEWRVGRDYDDRTKLRLYRWNHEGSKIR